jgi:hypothetical protein
LEQGEKMLEVDFLKHLNEKRTVIGVKASVYLKDDKTGRTVAWVIQKGVSKKLSKTSKSDTTYFVSKIHLFRKRSNLL